jgi:diadenosine tetraphosphatase ApaH/serine/threonine PP2A family protein phosphatase
MMDAVISDIHGNLEALDVVLDAIRRLGATRIICLGDLVCYGPDSLECVRRSAAWDVVLAGDWDLAMIHHDPKQWNPTINHHIEWVRKQFRAASDSTALLAILASYRRAFVDHGRHFTHGTPNDVREWVFPEDVYNPTKLNRIAEHFDTVCIGGHSHIQGVFTRDDHSEWAFVQPIVGEPRELNTGRKTMVTAGSVGQPRDGDPRACFLTIEGNSITFHRVEYDVAATVDKIRAIPEIDNLHGERLLLGR